MIRDCLLFVYVCGLTVLLLLSVGWVLGYGEERPGPPDIARGVGDIHPPNGEIPPFPFKSADEVNRIGVYAQPMLCENGAVVVMAVLDPAPDTTAGLVWMLWTHLPAETTTGYFLLTQHEKQTGAPTPGAWVGTYRVVPDGVVFPVTWESVAYDPVVHDDPCRVLRAGQVPA